MPIVTGKNIQCGCSVNGSTSGFHPGSARSSRVTRNYWRWWWIQVLKGLVPVEVYNRARRTGSNPSI